MKRWQQYKDFCEHISKMRGLVKKKEAQARSSSGVQASSKKRKGTVAHADMEKVDEHIGWTGVLRFFHNTSALQENGFGLVELTKDIVFTKPCKHHCKALVDSLLTSNVVKALVKWVIAQTQGNEKKGMSAAITQAVARSRLESGIVENLKIEADCLFHKRYKVSEPWLADLTSPQITHCLAEYTSVALAPHALPMALAGLDGETTIIGFSLDTLVVATLSSRIEALQKLSMDAVEALCKQDGNLCYKLRKGDFVFVPAGWLVVQYSTTEVTLLRWFSGPLQIAAGRHMLALLEMMMQACPILRTMESYSKLAAELKDTM